MRIRVSLTRSRAALLGAMALLTLGMAACGPAASSRGTGGTSSSRPAPAMPGAPGAVEQQVTISATAIGRTDPAEQVEVTLSLAGKAPGDLERFLVALNDPRSPDYHHYLTPAEYAARFGVDVAVAARVEATLRAAGLTITGSLLGGQVVTARGTAAQMEHFFGVTLENYQAVDQTRYHAPTRPAQIPATLHGMVLGMVGLDNRPAIHAAGIARYHTTPNDPPAYTPADLERLYHIGPLHRAGLDGTGQTIAIAEVDRFDQKDINTYDQKYGIQAEPVEVVGSTTAVSVETTLDIEVLHAIAPKAHLIAYESSAQYQPLVRNIAKIITENRAHVLSISLGQCEDAMRLGYPQFLPLLDTAFRQAAAQGMSVLVSSGDNGAYTCQLTDSSDFHLSVSWPADSPYVTAVGGTALFTKGDGTYDFEAGWESPFAVAGSGGGLSTVYPRPSWQTGPGTTNKYSNGKRQVPDVAADADFLTGYSIYYAADGSCKGDDCWSPSGGTSAATPFWAGLVALANQQAQKDGKPPLGFLNPALYQLAAQNLNPAPFHDIVVGGNLYYPAGPGWDYATGLGSPDAAVLIPALLAMPRT